MSQEGDGLHRSARGLRYGVVAAIALLLLLILAVVVTQPPISLAAPWLMVGVDGSGLAAPWSGWVAIVTMLLLVMGLVRLARMLRHIEGGAPFAPPVTAELRGFGRYLLAAALAGALLPPVIQLGLAWAARPAAARIQLGTDLETLLMLFVSLLVFFVARLFDEAARLAEDSRLIV